MSWLHVGRSKRSPEKEAGRPCRGWCGIQQQTKNFFLFHSNKRHFNKLCEIQTRHKLSNNLLVQGIAHNLTSFTNFFLPTLLRTCQPWHSHCPAFPTAFIQAEPLYYAIYWEPCMCQVLSRGKVRKATWSGVAQCWPARKWRCSLHSWGGLGVQVPAQPGGRGGRAAQLSVGGDAKTPSPLFTRMKSLFSGLRGRQFHSQGRDFLRETKYYMTFILSFSYIRG